ncbi:MAG TPA: permease-like cell division protein FtsX [Patescibacteria group bacterium]|nr:permease-like cell division protein FtsX [Patescibacteria group bacterium]
MIVRLRRVVILGLVNFWRNKWMSVAAVLIIMMTLIMMGTFVVLSFFANNVSKALKNKVTVQVDFTEAAEEGDIQNLQQALSSQAGVVASYISKEDALADFKSRADIKQSTRDLIDASNNPLPRGLRVRSVELDNLSKVETIVKQPTYQPIIYNFSYDDNKLLIERINNGTKFIKKTAAYLTVIFVVVAIFVTLNTIQMAIYARRDEIEVMRLVGASRAYVKIPFYVEGALYGVVAALMSFVIIYFGTKYFSGLSQSFLLSLDMDILKSIGGHFGTIMLSQLVAGLALGVVCSEISIRRYIRV